MIPFTRPYVKIREEEYKDLRQRADNATSWKAESEMVKEDLRDAEDLITQLRERLEKRREGVRVKISEQEKEIAKLREENTNYEKEFNRLLRENAGRVFENVIGVQVKDRTDGKTEGNSSSIDVEEVLNEFLRQQAEERRRSELSIKQTRQTFNQEMRKLKDEITAVNSKREEQRITITNLNSTITRLGSELNFQEEKDDNYFQDGFRKLEVFIRNWSRTHFKGLDALPAKVLQDLCSPRFHFQGNPGFLNEGKGGRREVGLLIQTWIAHVILYEVINVPVHPFIDIKLSSSVKEIEERISEGPEKLRWKARTINAILQDPGYADKTSNHLMDAFMTYFEKHVGPSASEKSTLANRQNSLRNVLDLTFKLTHEMRMLSSSMITYEWPMAGSAYDPGTMYSGEDEDKEEPTATIEVSLFPRIIKKYYNADGSMGEYTLRKASVVLMAPSPTENTKLIMQVKMEVENSGTPPPPKDPFESSFQTARTRARRIVKTEPQETENSNPSVGHNHLDDTDDICASIPPILPRKRGSACGRPKIEREVQ